MTTDFTHDIEYDTTTGLYKLSIFNEDGELETEFFDLGSIEEVNDILQSDYGYSLSEEQIADMVISNGIISGDYSDDDEDGDDWFLGSLKSFGDLYSDDEPDYDEDE